MHILQTYCYLTNKLNSLRLKTVFGIRQRAIRGQIVTDPRQVCTFALSGTLGCLPGKVAKSHD